MTERKQKRSQRLLVMLTDDELKVIDEWRFQQHMPSRAAAIRELIRAGLEVSFDSTNVSQSDPDSLDMTAQSSKINILGNRSNDRS